MFDKGLVEVEMSFLFCRVASHDKRGMWHGKWELQNLTSEPSLMLKGLVEIEILFLFYHVTSRGHIIKKSCDLANGSSKT